MANIGTKAYSPSRRMKSTSSCVRSARRPATAVASRPAAVSTAPVSTMPGPAWQSPADTASPPAVTAIAPAASSVSHPRGGATRSTTIIVSPVVSAALTVASTIGRQATGVASPSSRVGSLNATQPTNQSALPMIRPSSSSRAVAARVAAAPGSRRTAAPRPSAASVVPTETRTAHPVRWPCRCAQWSPAASRPPRPTRRLNRAAPAATASSRWAGRRGPVRRRTDAASSTAAPAATMPLNTATVTIPGDDCTRQLCRMSASRGAPGVQLLGHRVRAAGWPRGWCQTGCHA